MENIQAISKRSSILVKDQVFSLVILPTDDKKKTNLMFLWLLAWSVSGVIVMANYFMNKKLVILKEFLFLSLVIAAVIYQYFI